MLVLKVARRFGSSSTVRLGETHKFSPGKGLKDRATGHTPRGFINLKRILFEAGDGGDGCIAFQRLFCNPRAGPSGGDGGNGSHIVLQASPHVSDLSHLPAIVRGHSGAKGYPNNCHGANAAHILIQVPVGTYVYNLDESDDSDLEKDDFATPVKQPVGMLMHETSVFVAARGGAGGKGNTFLTNAACVNSTSKWSTSPNAPLRIAERGAQGEHRRLLLRMSRLAELGLVGAPNAGKSTLLRRLTRARPKVAPYAFTTLKPHMGVMNLPTSASHTHPLEVEDCLAEQPPASMLNDNYRLTIADLPGLLPGAATHNKGLGAEFLSLIADCRLLAYVIDVGTPWTTASENHEKAVFSDISDHLKILRRELFTFDKQLPDPHRCLVIGTKLDLVLPEQTDTSSSNDSQSDVLHTLTRLVAEAAVESDVLYEKDALNRVVVVSARRGDNVSCLVDRIQRCCTTSCEL